MSHIDILSKIANGLSNQNGKVLALLDDKSELFGGSNICWLAS